MVDLPLDLPDGLRPLTDLYNELRQQGSANGLKRSYINLSCSISQVLNQPVLTVFLDDDGSEFTCVSEHGVIAGVIAQCDQTLVT